QRIHPDELIDLDVLVVHEVDVCVDTGAVFQETAFHAELVVRHLLRIVGRLRWDTRVEATRLEARAGRGVPRPITGKGVVETRLPGGIRERGGQTRVEGGDAPWDVVRVRRQRDRRQQRTQIRRILAQNVPFLAVPYARDQLQIVGHSIRRLIEDTPGIRRDGTGAPEVAFVEQLEPGQHIIRARPAVEVVVVTAEQIGEAAQLDVEIELL